MSSKYEKRDVEVRSREVCIEHKCDMCDSVADYPEDQLWVWGGVGVASGRLEYSYCIDGEHEKEVADLCYDCAKKVHDFILSGPHRRVQS